MEKPNKRITDFIQKHHVLTLATSRENQPWCANCFYTYLKEENMLVFTSDEDTRHIAEASLNPVVAGSIVLETAVVGKIQGIQFTGIMEKPTDEQTKKVKMAYLKRFPFAVLMDTTLWVLKLRTIKMTDNRLGFGKKIDWVE
jgi:uncharacterized protein